MTTSSMRRATPSHSIDDYDIGQLLGKGGFASVYRARQRRTGQIYALKIMEKANIRKHKMEKRVENEMKIHSELHYKGIVQFHCQFEDKENVYMVLELCEGGNLFRYLKVHGPLSESESCAIIKELLLSLEYIHSMGIVHRDLKLSNVLIVQNTNLSSSISTSSSFSSSSTPSSSTPSSSPSSLNSYTPRNSPPFIASSSQSTSQSVSQSISKQTLRNEENCNFPSTKLCDHFSAQKLSTFSVKLCDFGLAVQVEHPDEVSTVCEDTVRAE